MSVNIPCTRRSTLIDSSLTTGTVPFDLWLPQESAVAARMLPTAALDTGLPRRLTARVSGVEYVAPSAAS